MMRNHLISVAIGFVLGGLVLVPLVMHWQSSPSTDVQFGAAGSGTGAQRAPIDLTDSVGLRRVPVGSRPAPDRRAASSTRSSGTARFSPPLRLPGRRPADARSISSRLAWRGDIESRRADDLHSALGMTAARGIARVRGIDDHATPQPLRHAILPTGFELRESLRLRHGMVASTLLAALPRAETGIITELPTLMRLDDNPAAMLPVSIVPTSVSRTGQLTTPQVVTDTIPASPVRLGSRSPLAVAFGDSAAPLAGTSATIAHGPVIPYGPAIPTTIPLSVAASGAPAPSMPVKTTSSVDSPVSSGSPAPTPTEPTAPVPTPPVPTFPMPTVPTSPAPDVPAPIPPLPNSPTLSAPNLPPPSAPVPPPYFPPAQPQFPDVRPDDDVSPLPEGVQVVFAGSIPAGSGGTAGGTSLVSYEIATGFGVDWEILESTPFGDGHLGFAAGLNAAAVSAVPEPVTALFVIVGAVALIGRRRSTRTHS